MNKRIIFNILGLIMELEAILLLPPLIVSLIYRDGMYTYFLITIAVSLAIGVSLNLLTRASNKTVYAKEGFVIVTLTWTVMSLIGALPFRLSGEIPSYIDAFFETVSGFTTTGASILNDVEAMAPSMLFWRSFTHWIGGMGVLVFIMAFMPQICDRSIHIMRAEVPGPIVGKLVPRLSTTAKILYLIYMGLTVLEAIFLMAGGMPLFDSIVHTFGTAGTGGFGIKADSIGSYSHYLQWVITVFMLLFGVNFNIYYFILIKRLKTAIKSSELWCYIGIVLIATGMIAVNISPLYESISEAVRHSAFQVVSLITTTGYATVDFDIWPSLSKMLLVTLMFIGGCAGSTAGGLKVSRVMMLFKIAKSEFRRLIHPRSHKVVRFEGKPLDAAILGNVSSYFTLYMIIYFLMLLLLSLDAFDFETNFTAIASCYNNIGPGLGDVGPTASFSAYSSFSKIVLSLAMLLGRLEIYPLLITLIPSTWAKR